MSVLVKVAGPSRVTRELEVREIRVKELLELLSLASSEHIVIRNGVVLTEEDVVRSGDEVVVYPVKSGG